MAEKLGDEVALVEFACIGSPSIQALNPVGPILLAHAAGTTSLTFTQPV